MEDHSFSNDFYSWRISLRNYLVWPEFWIAQSQGLFIQVNRGGL